MKSASEQLGVRRAAQEPKSSLNHCNLTLDGEHLLFYVGVIEYRISINEQHKCYPLQHCGKQKNMEQSS